MEKLKQFWNRFADKHPKISKWVREGGLFFIVSNGITILRGLFIPLLKNAFVPLLGDAAFGFPGIPLNIFGVEFDWYILGYSKNEGGVSYFTAFIIATVLFEIINFFIQRYWVFRSKGNIVLQFVLYFLAFCIVIPTVNSINCFWAALIPNTPEILSTIEGLGTTFITGGVAMAVFFFVNKLIFTDAKKEEKTSPSSETLEEESE